MLRIMPRAKKITLEELWGETGFEPSIEQMHAGTIQEHHDQLTSCRGIGSMRRLRG